MFFDGLSDEVDRLVSVRLGVGLDVVETHRVSILKDVSPLAGGYHGHPEDELVGGGITKFYFVPRDVCE